MTDRDHFAAAALTGLLSNVQRYQNEPLTKQAYEIAEFMLRERDRTNLDAVPEAKAAEPESSVPLGSVAAPANTHTLTDEEREAISEVVDCLTESGTALANPTNTRNTLAALLARLA